MVKEGDNKCLTCGTCRTKICFDCTSAVVFFLLATSFAFFEYCRIPINFCDESVPIAFDTREIIGVFQTDCSFFMLPMFFSSEIRLHTRERIVFMPIFCARCVSRPPYVYRKHTGALPWHEGQRCDELIDANYAEWARGVCCCCCCSFFSAFFCFLSFVFCLSLLLRLLNDH
jgi:hypothetical protein